MQCICPSFFIPSEVLCDNFFNGDCTAASLMKDGTQITTYLELLRLPEKSD